MPMILTAFLVAIAEVEKVEEIEALLAKSEV
jgi:hypothetical protein